MEIFALLILGGVAAYAAWQWKNAALPSAGEQGSGSGTGGTIGPSIGGPQTGPPNLTNPAPSHSTQSYVPTPPSVGARMVTAAMKVGATFTSRGAIWDFQGGQHLGTDYLGAQGTPVYAPYDMRYVTTGYYPPSANGGAETGFYVVGILDDGSQYYSGHLQNVPSFHSGQIITAGTQIGETNQLGHTHVQLKSPAGVLEDFQQYLASHP